MLWRATHVRAICQTSGPADLTHTKFEEELTRQVLRLSQGATSRDLKSVARSVLDSVKRATAKTVQKAEAQSEPPSSRSPSGPVALKELCTNALVLPEHEGQNGFWQLLTDTEASGMRSSADRQGNSAQNAVVVVDDASDDRSSDHSAGAGHSWRGGTSWSGGATSLSRDGSDYDVEVNMAARNWLIGAYEKYPHIVGYEVNRKL